MAAIRGVVHRVVFKWIHAIFIPIQSTHVLAGVRDSRIKRFPMLKIVGRFVLEGKSRNESW